MTGRSIARVGAAAVVLGLSLAGPHAGVAAADGPDADSGAASTGGAADQKSSPRSPRGGMRGATASSTEADSPAPRPTATVRGARTDVPAASSSRRSAAPRPTRDAPADNPGGSGSRTCRRRQPRYPQRGAPNRCRLWCQQPVVPPMSLSLSRIRLRRHQRRPRTPFSLLRRRWRRRLPARRRRPAQVQRRWPPPPPATQRALHAGVPRRRHSVRR